MKKKKSAKGGYSPKPVKRKLKPLTDAPSPSPSDSHDPMTPDPDDSVKKPGKKPKGRKKS